jgi:hypothetical protein
VLSEFGTWGLPRLDRVVDADGRRPWWFETGRDQLRPAGVADRFSAYGLDRVWGSLDELADATQRHQLEALQFEIGQLRRHDSIQGYVITELSDAYWEANGLLDVHRGPKAYHDRPATFNSQDVVVADLDRRDIWAGDTLHVPVHLASYGATAPGGHGGGRVEWILEGPDGRHASGEIQVVDWPEGGARCVGQLDVVVPPCAVGDARLVVRAIDGTGARRAADEYRLAILPRSARLPSRALAIGVTDPLGSWQLEERIAALGHRPSTPDHGDVRVATEIVPEFLAAVEAGSAGLVLARDGSALGGAAGLQRPVQVRARTDSDATPPDRPNPWGGDWVTAWSWLLPGALPGLPARNPLDFAYAEVIPDHVLTGYDPGVHRDEVIAGMFAGWVHAPAALAWTFPQGLGRLTVTTFRLAPESGPVATVMLDGLLHHARGVVPQPPMAASGS